MVYSILDYLEDTASRLPEKIAIADDKKSVIFRLLVTLSKSIGTALIHSCSKSIRKPVVVFVDRNTESLISFLGVAYSGNFYVPVDTKMPAERIRLIFETLNPSAAITISASDNKILDDIGYKGSRLFFSVAATIHPDETLLNAIRYQLLDIDPLYAIFTSGSTGIPKGVLISHRAVIDLAEWLVKTFNFTESDILGNQTPFYFDGSVKDIYISIKTGATLYILPRKFFSFPKLLVEFLNEKKVTSLLWATSAIIMIGNSNILQENELKYVKNIFFAGEAMPAKQLNVWRKHLPHARYINLYGPTEVTVDCTYYILEREFSNEEYIPIGFPCRNKEILVLNEENHLVEGNQQGELCVRGTGVALGYYNNLSRTREVFVQNPLHNTYEDLIYRTGDIVKYNEYNELVFVSRKDFQVKHMGNRIELGEIEAIVNSLDNVTEAACIYDHEKQKIVLFYSTSNGEVIDVINSIKSMLPKYMFPNFNFIIDRLPHNYNGKIDRLKLHELYENA